MRPQARASATGGSETRHPPIRLCLENRDATCHRTTLVDRWRGETAEAPPIGSARAGRALDLSPTGRQMPSVRSSLLLSLPPILDQLQTRQPVEELGDLPLVDDPGPF